MKETILNWIETRYTIDASYSVTGDFTDVWISNSNDPLLLYDNYAYGLGTRIQYSDPNFFAKLAKLISKLAKRN